MASFIHSEIGFAHVASASVALILGTLVLAIPKGTLMHKRIGYAYVVCMLALNATAFGIYHLFGTFGMFHILALVSLVTVASGMIPFLLKMKNGLRLHISQMYFSVIGLYAAFIAETAVRVPSVVKNMAGFWIIVIASSVLTFVIGVVVYVKKYKFWQPAKAQNKPKFMTSAAIIIFSLLLPLIGTAQQLPSTNIGFQVNSIGGDYGLGVSVGFQTKSPHFGINLVGSQNWLEHLTSGDVANTSTTWTGYQTLWLAFNGGGYINKNIRLYGGGGPMVGFVKNISTSPTAFGGFGY